MPYLSEFQLPEEPVGLALAGGGVRGYAQIGVLDMLDKHMPKEVHYTRPEGGLFIWCTLPDGVDMNAFVKAAIAKKVAVVPGTAFNCDTEAPSQSFRLNYSTPSDDDIRRGIEMLGEVAREMLG